MYITVPGTMLKDTFFDSIMIILTEVSTISPHVSDNTWVEIMTSVLEVLTYIPIPLDTCPLMHVISNG